jgi:hypothetical protein
MYEYDNSEYSGDLPLVVKLICVWNTVKPGYSDSLWTGKLQHLMMLSVNEEEIQKWLR